MRIGHYQCICAQGDFEKNLDTVIHGLDLAADAGLGIVSFPESFLNGYFHTEAEARENCFAIDSDEMGEMLDRTRQYDSLFMVGFNELRDDALHNTVVVVERGKIRGQYSKAFPCIRYFVPGREFPVFTKGDLTFGVIICADGGYVEPARILALKGARLIFAPHFNSVSDPVRHYQTVRNDHVARAVENGVYFLRANNVIPTPERVEPGTLPSYGYGDSYLLDPQGEIVAGAGLYDEYLMIYNLELDRTNRSPRVIRSRQSGLALLDQLKAALDQSEE